MPASRRRSDYVSLHMGTYWRFHKLIGPSDEPLGLEMPANAEITPAVAKPTIVVGRIMTLDHASAIVAGGEGDMVSMVRALIADPELVNKARRLEEHRIRPCIGTNMGCVGQLMSRGVLSCVVNVAAAAETRLSFEPEGKAPAPKRVLVVGGGPAGLEAARTLALRGHHVELHEANRRTGGQVALAAMGPKRADVGQIVRWLSDEIETLGVEVHLNSLVDAETIARIAPDEVVIATGAMQRADGFQLSTPAVPIPGHDQPHVYNVWELFGVGRRVAVEGPVLIYDDSGTFEAISAADILLERGVEVVMVSRFDQPGATIPFPIVTVGAARERLMSGNFDFIGGHYLRGIGTDTAEIGVLFTPRRRTIACKTVVLAGMNEPNRALAEELEGQGPRVHLVGDVLGRNTIMAAIHSAAAVGRAI